MAENKFHVPTISDDCDIWLEWCRERLTHYADNIHADPMTNSVQKLAHDLSVLLEDGRVSLNTISKLMAVIGGQALVQRADRFNENHIDNNGLMNILSMGPMQSPDEDFQSSKDKEEDFQSFKDKYEQTRAGVVFTGHPTFAISRAIRADFTEYVCAQKSNDKTDEGARQRLLSCQHRPDDEITITSEHEDVRNAIHHAAGAVTGINRKILMTAKKKFPTQWQDLCPQPISVATWVGYDLDGRTDIHWGQTLTIRLLEKAEQLENYATALKAISLKDKTLNLTSLHDRISASALLTREQADLFAGDLNDPAIVVAAANALTASHKDKIISLTPIMEEISVLIEESRDEEVQVELCLLRAQMKAMGLGVARIHLRVNAAQVRSALKHDFGILSDDDFMGRSTLAIAADQARSTKVNMINFTSVFLEQMTARRQFMLCAQILKHIDADTPIRFLIAECEAPSTVMGAVYLARLYGVEEKLDISPLFETPEALERGGRFLERLLQEEEYRKYIQARGRISIQLGFSDSGRFMGQIAADLAIERLHILLARALKTYKIKNVEALIFNTNGESMGRGGYAGPIEDRLHHLITPWTRATFLDANIHVNAESAFQGGEGFLHFYNDEIATRTMDEIFRISFQHYDFDRSDAFYSDINFSWDFYRGVKAWQEDLFNHPDYTTTIAAFGQKFLFTTGSRKTRRQRKGSADMSPRALRAIPHNAILQQMAIPANVACGCGSAIRQEADRFVEFTQKSDRMSRLMGMAEQARNLTSLPAFLGYANIHNATYWTRRATTPNASKRGQNYLAIAGQLADQKVYTALCRLANHFAHDLSAFDEVLKNIHGDTRKTERHEDRLELHILHALRQSVIMYALILVTDLPEFSGRHDVTRSDLIDLVLHLQFDDLTGLLDEIFPVFRPEVAALSGIEEETSLDLSKEGGYPQVHETVKSPLIEIQKIVQETGVALSHFYGAYG